MGLTLRHMSALRVLSEQENPIRRLKLWRLCEWDPFFRKRKGDNFWSMDTTILVDRMVKNGWVAKLTAERKVWYRITYNGRMVYEDAEFGSSKTRRRLYKSRIHRLMSQLGVWSDYDKIKEQIDSIVEMSHSLKERRSTLKNRYTKILYVFEYHLRENHRHLFNDNYRRLIGHTLAYITEDGFDADELLQDAIWSADMKLIANGELTKASSEAFEYSRKVIGHCVMCNRDIHNSNAVKEAELLAKYSGMDTKNVCCNCYMKLRTYEEIKKIVEVN